MLEAVFRACWRKHIHLHNVKFSILRDRANFWGRIIVGGTIKPLESYALGLLGKNKPMVSLALKSFLGGCVWVHDWIPDFGRVTAPLYKLVAGRKDRDRLEWTPEAEVAYFHVRGCLSKVEPLYLADMEEEFFLFSDASRQGWGLVVCQLRVPEEWRRGVLTMARIAMAPHCHLRTVHMCSGRWKTQAEAAHPARWLELNGLRRGLQSVAWLVKIERQDLACGRGQ